MILYRVQNDKRIGLTESSDSPLLKQKPFPKNECPYVSKHKDIR